MPRVNIVRSTPIERSARVMQLEGLFEVPTTTESRVEWTVDLPIESFEWNIGLIVGPSGCGKTTIARELFAEQLVDGFEWPAAGSILDGFPRKMPVKEITALLGSVGFSSPPNWLRPFHVLSNGEQFRATVARALAEHPRLVVLDEFTSVVDRQVAQVGSAAVAKAVRRRGNKLIAVGCHYDVIDWLQPDWTYEPATGEFTRRSLQRRPSIELEIRPAKHALWPLFAPHHYLSRDLSSVACRAYVGLVDGSPATFAAVKSFPHATRAGWREHRVVCLPDFQGVGIGNAMSEFIAGCYRATKRPYFSTTGNPAMIHHRARSPLWRMLRRPSLGKKQNPTIMTPTSLTRQEYKGAAVDRLTASFEFVGAARPDDARAFGII